MKVREALALLQSMDPEAELVRPDYEVEGVHSVRALVAGCTLSGPCGSRFHAGRVRIYAEPAVLVR